MHKAIQFRVKGVSPIIMHNGQTTDPLSPYAKRIKEISSKRIKTDDDHAAMSAIEWEAGLYLDENMRVCFPGENIESAFFEAAGKFKLKKQCRSGLLSDGNWPLIYDGPKNLDKLKADPRFIDRRRIKVQQSAVMRTRPIFVNWGLEFTVHYLPDQLNRKQVEDLADAIGRNVGIGDYRPKYGRFAVESVK